MYKKNDNKYILKKMIFGVVANLVAKSFLFNINLKLQLDVDPQRDDDASPMSTYRCMLRPT